MTDFLWIEPAVFLQFCGSEWSVSLARRVASVHLTDLDDEQADSIRLAISELVSDSIRSPGACGGFLAMWVSERGARVRVEVSDNQAVPVGEAPPLESALAMGILVQLAERWGVDELYCGRRIWAEFDTRGSASGF